VSFKRGAWLRLYGIPLHAWSDDFFKLCVMDCETFLRTNLVSLDRVRFDYARVLIVTSSLDIVDCVESLLIDDVMVDVKIVEEWGFKIGEDACLFEEGEESPSQSDNEDAPVDIEARNNVENFVDKIIEELDSEDLNGRQQSGNVENVDTHGRIVSPVAGVNKLKDFVEEDIESEGSHNASMCAFLNDVGVFEIAQTRGGPILEEVFHDVEVPPSKVFSPTVMKDVVAEPDILASRRVRSASGLPDIGKAAMSRPWSVEWLQDHHNGGAGVIFSSKKKLKKRMHAKVKKCFRWD